MSPTPQPELSALNEPSKHKVTTHAAPDGTPYNILAKRQCTGNAKKAVPNATSSITTRRTLDAAAPAQTAEVPQGISTTRISGDTDISSKEDNARLTTILANEVIQVNKDGNILEHCDGSIGPVPSRKDQLKVATPTQATGGKGKSKSKDTMPAQTGKGGLNTAAVAESLSESDDDDKKEFSELYYPQNEEAKNLMTYRMAQSKVGKLHIFLLLTKPQC